MSDYILFIDTETSDKPREWNASTAEVDKWPYLLQVAWLVCNKTGEIIVEHNYYINPGEITIHPESLEVHGISLEFLQENGLKRSEVLQKLSKDIFEYQPILVGHFLKFDLKMLEVGFNRININLDLSNYLKFCTMVHSEKFFHGTHRRQLRLNEMYFKIFCKELHNQHDAQVDVNATKECYFEMVKRGDINEKTIIKQQNHFVKKNNRNLFGRFFKTVSIFFII